MSYEAAGRVRIAGWVELARPFAEALGLRVFEDEDGCTVHASDRSGFIHVTLERMDGGYPQCNLIEFPVGVQFTQFDFNTSFSKAASELLDGEVGAA